MKERKNLKLKKDLLTLDPVDLKILKALQENSRQTYAAIGRQVGVAHSTVYDRITRMEQQQVIKKYTTVIDAERIGMRSLTAMMTVYTDPKETGKVAEKLSESLQVLEVYVAISEELLIMAKVSALNQEDLHKFIADSVAPLAGVLRIRTSVITKKVKETQSSIIDNLK